MSEAMKIVECPRDAWQGLAQPIPADIKADYLQTLVAAGFRSIDAVSFVSPASVPQMADSEIVLDLMDPPDDCEILGIVVNRKGAERAIRTGAVSTIGFPYSLSAEFLRRNQSQTHEEALDTLEQVGEAAYKAGLDLVVYLSMAFGNPFGEVWDVEEVLAACDLLADNGIGTVNLADTVGIAPAEMLGSITGAVVDAWPEMQVGVHLHTRSEDISAKVRAVYEAGCRRLDMTIGGLGGCPFAQDALLGNLATEAAVAELRQLGARLPLLSPLDGLVAASREIEKRFGGKLQ
jgi:hydroxymethylglutaryl-CoA lyase